MASKVIAVWGSSGSGKTTLSLALAWQLSKRHKRRVVVLSTDTQTPALPVFLPTIPIPASKSIGNVLMSNNFTFSNVQEKLHLHPDNENLTFMGLTEGEHVMTYNAFEREKIVNLIKALNEEQDYIVVDCCTQPMLDMMSLTALEIADDVIHCTTPDTKGIHFLKAQLPTLIDAKYHSRRHIRVLTNITPQSPVETVDSLNGGSDFYFPWSGEVGTQITAGGEIGGFHKRLPWEDNTGWKFEKEIKKLTERVMQDASESGTANRQDD